MRRLFLALMFSVSIVNFAIADEANLTPETSLSVTDTLKNLPSVKEGFMYDFKHNRGLNVLGLEVANASFIGSSDKWRALALDVAWIGSDGLGAVINYSLSSFPVQSLPVLNYLQYLNIGYGAGYRTLTSDTDGGNPKSDNQFISGPVAFIKLKF